MGMEKNLPCSIADVVELIGIKVVRNTGSQLHCRCPFCDDRSAHLNVKLSDNVFRCNRCGKGGGVLHLYAYMHDVSLNTAYDELCRIYLDGQRNLYRPNLQNRRSFRWSLLADSAVRITHTAIYSMLSSRFHRESLLARGLSNRTSIGLDIAQHGSSRAEDRD